MSLLFLFHSISMIYSVHTFVLHSLYLFHSSISHFNQPILRFLYATQFIFIFFLISICIDLIWYINLVFYIVYSFCLITLVYYCYIYYTPIFYSNYKLNYRLCLLFIYCINHILIKNLRYTTYTNISMLHTLELYNVTCISVLYNLQYTNTVQNQITLAKLPI